MKKILNTMSAKMIILLSVVAYPSMAMARVNVDELFKKYRVTGPTEYSELNNVANLPDGEIGDLAVEIIFIILRISSILTFLAFTVSGIMFIISRGEGDSNMLEKAKKTVTFAIIGVIIIMISYALVYGITALQYNP